MDEKSRKMICARAGELMGQGYHCSEAIWLSVGGRYLGEETAWKALRLASPFAGGVGGTREELCGALSGGLMVIGGLCGRKDGPMPDEECQALAAEFRAAFLREFGWVRCCDLKENWVGKSGQATCRELVERAAGVLLSVIEGDTHQG